jgi:hypothetical protein
MPYKGERPLLLRTFISLSIEILTFLRCPPLHGKTALSELREWVGPDRIVLRTIGVKRQGTGLRVHSWTPFAG